MKKKVLSVVATLVLVFSSFCQAPEGFKYQAVVRDAGNVILNNQTVGIRMTIQQGSIGGAIVYQETFASTTNAFGLVNLEIGNGTVISGNFAAIDWANGPFYIETAVDVTGGTGYVVIGTSQLMSVPYALYAKSSGSPLPGPQGPQGPIGPLGSGFTHYIGEQFGGGVIYHLWKDSLGIEHGLIVDVVNIASGVPWGNAGTLIGLGAQSPWYGLTNSLAIVAVGWINPTAADICINSNNGGFSDWYLPAREELLPLRINFYDIGKVLNSIIGADEIGYWEYWTSTEWNASTALVWSVTGVSSAPKSYLGQHVRAIRSF